MADVTYDSLKEKPLLVLDIDQTLVNSKPFTSKCDKTYDISIEGNQEYLCSKERPHLSDFFDFATKNFSLMIYTSASREYANIISKHFNTRYGVTFVEVVANDVIEKHVKTLDFKIKRIIKKNNLVKPIDLIPSSKRVVIVDDNNYYFKGDGEIYSKNLYQIEAWEGRENDNELSKLIEILRKWLKQSDKIQNYLESRDEKENGCYSFQM